MEIKPTKCILLFVDMCFYYVLRYYNPFIHNFESKMCVENTEIL